MSVQLFIVWTDWFIFMDGHLPCCYWFILMDSHLPVAFTYYINTVFMCWYNSATGIWASFVVMGGFILIEIFIGLCHVRHICILMIVVYYNILMCYVAFTFYINTVFICWYNSATGIWASFVVMDGFILIEIFIGFCHVRHICILMIVVY